MNQCSIYILNQVNPEITIRNDHLKMSLLVELTSMTSSMLNNFQKSSERSSILRTYIHFFITPSSIDLVDCIFIWSFLNPSYCYFFHRQWLKFKIWTSIQSSCQKVIRVSWKGYPKYLYKVSDTPYEKNYKNSNKRPTKNV